MTEIDVQDVHLEVGCIYGEDKYLVRDMCT